MTQVHRAESCFATFLDCRAFTAWLVALLFFAHSIGAQQPGPAQSGTLRGTIVAEETGNALVTALEAIPALSLEQFSSRDGAFYFAHVAPGTYRLRVRQLGYSPTEQSVTITAGDNAPVKIVMRHIMTKLAAMHVVDEQKCTAPGRPSADVDAALTTIFEQMEQNAARLQLFSNLYPFEMRIEHIRLMQRNKGMDSLQKIDTTTNSSTAVSSYRPGGVVGVVTNALGGRETHVRIPTLLEFADPTFQQNHCFSLRGVETIDNTKRIRIDFTSAPYIRTPDVDGSVFLDSATYRVLRVEFRTVNLPTPEIEMRGLTAYANFKEMYEGVPELADNVGVFTLPPSHQRNAYLRGVDQQLPISIKFRRQRPDSTQFRVRTPP